MRAGLVNPPHLKEKDHRVMWLEGLARIDQGDYSTSPFGLIGAYCIASILRYGNGLEVLPTVSYNALCEHLLENIDAKGFETGSRTLKADYLRNHSGDNMELFASPWHDSVSIILGSRCQCHRCKNNPPGKLF